jgi:acyl carrier protein
LQAVTPSERLELAITSVRKLAAKVMAMDQDNLPDPRRTLNELGFDSLTAVEFVNRVGQSIGQQISPSLLFDYPTLESLSQYVVRDLLQLDTATSSSSEAEVTELDFLEKAATDVEEMSEEEMDAEVTRQIELLSI